MSAGDRDRKTMIAVLTLGLVCGSAFGFDAVGEDGLVALGGENGFEPKSAERL